MKWRPTVVGKEACGRTDFGRVADIVSRAEMVPFRSGLPQASLPQATLPTASLPTAAISSLLQQLLRNLHRIQRCALQELIARDKQRNGSSGRIAHVLADATDQQVVGT